MATTIVTESGGYVVPPCPWWCVLGADHDLDEVTALDYDGSAVRMHKAAAWTIPANANLDQRPMIVEVVQTISIGTEEQESDEAPSVFIEAHGLCLTSEQARAAGHALLTAADALAVIERTATSGDVR